MASELRVDNIVERTQGEGVTVNELNVATKLDVTGAEVVGLPSPPTPPIVLTPSYARIVDQKGSGADGGSNSTGQYRTLNTKEHDPDSIVSLSSDAFTLQAGEYIINYSAPTYSVYTHQAWLTDVTAGNSYVHYGTSGHSQGTVYGAQSSFGTYYVTLNAPNTYKIYHKMEKAAGGSGLGSATVGSSKNIYTTVDITKLDGVDAGRSIVESGEHFTWNSDDFGQPDPDATQEELDQKQEEQDKQDAIQESIRAKLNALGLTTAEMSVLGVLEEECD